MLRVAVTIIIEPDGNDEDNAKASNRTIEEVVRSKVVNEIYDVVDICSSNAKKIEIN